MLTIPQPLIDTICKYVKSTYLPKRMANPKHLGRFTDTDIDFFAPTIAKLSAAFTSERDDLPKQYLNLKEYRSAYILYFVIANYLKFHRSLEEAFRNEAPPATLRLIDVGSGPGTALFAAADFAKARNIALEVIATDQNSNILKDAAALMRLYAPTVKCRTIVWDIRKGESRIHGDAADVIIFGNVLNEMSSIEKRLKFVRGFSRNYLKPEGRIIIIEPALQKMTRDLMELRDMLIDPDLSPDVPVRILAPCLHQSRCPMLTHNARDWCHAYLDWRRPDLIEEIDYLIGLRKDYLKYSYLILQLGMPSTTQPAKTLWRVVSSPLRSKGKQELLLCNDEKSLFRITCLDKDRSPTNAGFEQTVRGDIVKYSGSEKMTREDRFEIQKRTALLIKQ